jgi:hypothetical protein
MSPKNVYFEKTEISKTVLNCPKLEKLTAVVRYLSSRNRLSHDYYSIWFNLTAV